MPDFRAAERTFQLLAQVAGRAGRAELPGEVFVQSYDPSAAAIRAAAAGDYAAFAERELKDRAEGFFPPFCHLALVAVSSKDASLAAGWAELYARSLAAYAAKAGEGKLLVSEALPSVLEKADGWFRWQVVLRAPRAGTMVRAWRWISRERPPPKNVRMTLDVDAYQLM
jgi:primosomal protein N' (replication factor Y)